jgi:hypothetical protein
MYRRLVSFVIGGILIELIPSRVIHKFRKGTRPPRNNTHL